MRKTSKAGRRLGLTLIEVVIASAIIFIVVTGVYQGVIQGLRLNYACAQRIAAFGLCKDRLEQMRGAAYADITPTNFPAETMKLTHRGGSERIPINCERSSSIQEYSNPILKNVTVTVAWEFAGRTLEETLSAAIYYKDSTVLPGAGAPQSVGGSINLNPNNSPDNEFTLVLLSGNTITRDDLVEDFEGYQGGATAVHVKPKGNGDQNSLIVGGQPYTIFNSCAYDITSEAMTVNLYNDNINPQGKAVGKWWIGITADEASVSEN